MGKLKKDGLIASLGIMFIALFIFMTNPRSLSAAWLLFMPILIAITVFAVTRLLLRLTSTKTEQLMTTTSGIVAAGSLVVVLLGSLKQLGLQDGLLALVLVAGLIFYFRRSGIGQTQTPHN